MDASSNKPADTLCANHDYAYLIDPPTTVQNNDVIFQCSTEFPWANHRQFTSQYGSNFKMNCGHRHGTDYIGSDNKPSLEECMNARSAIVTCHSVDYHKRTQKCYFSNHQGEPTIPALGFSSTYSLGCPGARSGNGNGRGSYDTKGWPAPELPFCPTKHGKILDVNGIPFQIFCDQAYTTMQWKTIKGPTGSEQCVSECAKDSTCQGAN